MRKIEIFDEDNSIRIDEEFDETTIDFFPESKKFEIRRSVKNDALYFNSLFEYKISANPTEVYVRLLEDYSEPPKKYSVKDNVVLESEIRKDGERFASMRDRKIEHLKEVVEWHKAESLSGYEITFFILSKHPEIISNEDYRKYLRQNEQRIKDGLSKIETFLKGHDKTGLEIIEREYGKEIAYLDGKLTEKNKDMKDVYKYLEEDIKKPLFTKGESNYCGISEYEFSISTEVLKYIDDLLNKKENISSKVNNDLDQKNNLYGLGYVWTIIVNLITIGIVFRIFSHFSGGSDTIVVSILILIYLSIRGFMVSYGITATNKVFYLDSEFKRIRKLLKNEPNESEIEDIKEAKKKASKTIVKMYINGICLIIIYLITFFYLWGALK